MATAAKRGSSKHLNLKGGNETFWMTALLKFKIGQQEDEFEIKDTEGPREWPP